MTYFFILGSNPALSVAELCSVFGKAANYRLLNNKVLLLDADTEINIKEKMICLGGTVKAGLVFDTIIKIKTDFIVNKTKNIVRPGLTKYKFGISYYGHKKINLKPIGMEIKKHLKESGINSRWVTSKESVLSSVVVEQNKLTQKGLELSIIEDSGKFHLGRTISVQPFKSLSFRDYGRPSRDDHSGMLPPKLAQIMLNLSGAKKNEKLLDPFCGSGTIITEAMLMGFSEIFGSDISEKAINDSRANVGWITKKFSVKNQPKEIREYDATKISDHIKSQSIKAIVSEPFLGKQRGLVNIKQEIKDLEALYSKALKEFRKVLKADGRIVLVFPVFFNKHFIYPELQGFKIIDPLPKEIRKNGLLKTTKRHTMIYGRGGQKIFREIVLLKKQ